MLLQFRFIFYNQTLLVALHVQPHASQHLYMNIHAMNVSRFHILMCTVCFYECTYLYMQSLSPVLYCLMYILVLALLFCADNSFYKCYADKF